MNIIVVDDEPYALDAMRQAVCEALPNEAPACFLTAKSALEHARQTPVDVAFLDIQMRDMDGLELAQRLAAIKPDTNIIFVTGHTQHMAAAFEQHASGYVQKPVQAQRVQQEMANLRYRLPGEGLRELGPYTFDHTARRVYHNGRDTLLSPKEYHLFCLLAGSPGMVFTPEDIFRRIWGDEPVGSIHNTVRVHISGLRRKLGTKTADSPQIRQRRGVGYYLDMAE